jgi:hypothetical protein
MFSVANCQWIGRIGGGRLMQLKRRINFFPERKFLNLVPEAQLSARLKLHRRLSLLKMITSGSKKYEKKTTENQKINLLFHEFDFKDPVGFENSAYITALDSQFYDIIIIDGQDWTFDERITCFRHAEKLVKHGDVIVLDDYWRYEALNTSNKTITFRAYESTGPCRFGVTSTALFLLLMGGGR